MANIKYTKGELKKQRDALRQYLRYLPTLQLKKQQLQSEILHQAARIEERRAQEHARAGEAQIWAGLLSDEAVDLRPWIAPRGTIVDTRNIAGVDIPIYKSTEFGEAEYDLFLVPLWVDAAVDALKAIISLRQELETLRKGMEILRQELRTTTQRVNLFEKVKIPEAEEAIRRIKIHIGDQMTNAVGRSKIAKKKIEKAVPVAEGAFV